MENKNTPVAATAPVINYTDPEIITLLKQTVARGTTDAEFALFVQQCKATGLNPFKKEIWCIKTKDQLQLMTGINGYYEIANRHPAFDGIETETIEEGGRLVKAVARVYRKDRSRPTTAEAHIAEYGKNYGNWQKMPRLMLSKCAESMALRKSFPQELNGIYTDAEMPGEYTIESAAVAPSIEPRKMPANERIEPDLSPDAYKLQAPKSQYKGVTLAEIHKTDANWIPVVLSDKRRQAACTQRDLVNLRAFWAVIGPDLSAELDSMDADGMFDVREVA